MVTQQVATVVGAVGEEEDLDAHTLSLLFVLQKAGLFCIFQQRYTPWRTGSFSLLLSL